MQKENYSFKPLLTFKCLISVAVSVSIILATYAFLYINNYEESLLLKSDEEFNRNSNIISESLSVSLWNFDEKNINKQLESLGNNVDYCGANVKDSSGKIVMSNSVEYSKKIKKHYSRDIIYLLGMSAEKIGSIELCFSLDRVFKEIDAQIETFIFTFTLLLIIVLILVLISVSFITRPLKQMQKHIRKVVKTLEPIESKNLNKADEIGELTKSFNDMMFDLKNTQQEIIGAKDKAEMANSAKTEFIANISHELRTPLHGILSYANLGIKKADSIKIDKIISYFDTIKLSADRLMQLINTLLDIAQLESGRMNFQFKSTNLANLVRESINCLIHLANEKKISIELIESEDNMNGIMDPNKMLEVINNLLANAIKYTPENHSIKIELSCEDLEENLKFSITNFGIAIPINELDIIFDKFIQSSITKTGAGGTGLGLSVSKYIIEMHKGQIWAENLNDKATKFIFVIPK